MLSLFSLFLKRLAILGCLFTLKSRSPKLPEALCLCVDLSTCGFIMQWPVEESTSLLGTPNQKDLSSSFWDQFPAWSCRVWGRVEGHMRAASTEPSARREQRFPKFRV